MCAKGEYCPLAVTVVRNRKLCIRVLIALGTAAGRGWLLLPVKCLSGEGTGLVKFTTVALSKYHAGLGCHQHAALLVFVSNVLFMFLLCVKVFIDPEEISQAKSASFRVRTDFGIEVLGIE